jgi:hypothetical protein
MTLAAISIIVFMADIALDNTLKAASVVRIALNMINAAIALVGAAIRITPSANEKARRGANRIGLKNLENTIDSVAYLPKCARASSAI